MPAAKAMNLSKFSLLIVAICIVVPAVMFSFLVEPAFSLYTKPEFRSIILAAHALCLLLGLCIIQIERLK